MPWSAHGMVVAGEAANGAKALEFLEEHEVDLLFVDLSMPVMSGLELIQAARRRYPNLRSVVLTFHEEFEHVQTAYRMGVLDYISKARMDVEDNEQILGRIRRQLKDEELQPHRQDQPARLVQRAPTRAAADKNAHAREEEQWRRLEQDWRSQYWLYNEAIFQRLCERTIESNPPVRRLEGLFMRVIAQIEAAARLGTEFWSEAEDVRSALDWIRRYREQIYAQIERSADLTKNAVCILKAVTFIREEAAKPLHAEDVAEHVSMSRSYFSQIFKKLTGTTFNDYLKQERIRAAERLLSETEKPVAWIANAVGYGDPKYFAQLFYEQTRLLPSEFRAQRRKGDR
nr:helix-turn-helix domain-containing protein [Cohnella zeiphila]